MSYGRMRSSLKWRIKLKEARERFPYSQKELGKVVGISHQAIQKYESGDASPSLDVLLTMASALNVSLDWLFDDDRDESLDDDRVFRNAVKLSGGVKGAYHKLAGLGPFLPGR